MSGIENKLNLIQAKLDDVNDVTTKIDKDLALHKAQFEAHIEQDEKMYEEFKRMNDILQQNTDSLKEHMHRTDLLESLVAKMDERITPVELEHIKKKAVSDWMKDKAIFIAKVAAAVTGAAAMAMLFKDILLKLLS
jgi:hypothetical protein